MRKNFAFCAKSYTHVFQDNCSYNDLFYTGRFDFVVYERQAGTKIDIPILAIELDGREHQEKAVVMERDKKEESHMQRTWV